MESMNFEIVTEDQVYKVGKKAYMFISVTYRLLYLTTGVWLGSILYSECLQSPTSNTFVIIYLGILSLACFQAAGIPVDRLVNLDLIKS